MPDAMLWVTKSDEDVPSLEDVEDEVGRLDYVSEVDVRTEGSVVHVSFRGGKAEQEEIEATIRAAGYDIFKVSTEKGNGRSRGSSLGPSLLPLRYRRIVR